MLSQTVRRLVVALSLGAVVGVAAASSVVGRSSLRAVPPGAALRSLQRLENPVVSGDLGEVVVTAPGDLGEVIVHAPGDLGEVLVSVRREPGDLGEVLVRVARTPGDSQPMATAAAAPASTPAGLGAATATLAIAR